MRTSLAAKHSLLIGALVAEAGKLELESVCFDLPDMVEEVVDLLAGQAQSKNLELACLVEDDVPSTIRADLGRLRQILVNLVGNAVKFTERGEVIVHVALARAPSAAPREGEEPPAGATWLQLTVTDTGVGVPGDRKDQIFESFTQADGTMARRFGGTGLGLAISKQLVDLMVGEIGCAAKPAARACSTAKRDFSRPCTSQPSRWAARRIVPAPKPTSSKRFRLR